MCLVKASIKFCCNAIYVDLPPVIKWDQILRQDKPYFKTVQ